MKELRDFSTVAELKASKLDYEIAVSQTKALTTLAESVKAIATFLTSNRLPEILEGYAKASAVNGILQGLVTHSGRGGMDARLMKQNAIEASEFIEKCFEHYSEKLAAKKMGEVDTEIHDGENDFKKWQEQNKK